MAVDWIKFRNLFVRNKFDVICPKCGNKAVKQAVNYQGDKLYKYDTYLGLEKPVLECKDCEFQFVKPTEYSKYCKTYEFYGEVTPRRIRSQPIKRRNKWRFI